MAIAIQKQIDKQGKYSSHHGLAADIKAQLGLAQMLI